MQCYQVRVRSRVKVQMAIAAQPAMSSIPPYGATFLRTGSPVIAWWYKDPQKPPMPAKRMVPACGEKGKHYLK